MTKIPRGIPLILHHNRKFQFVTNHLKTQSATDSYFVYVLKMEYVPKINMFGLKTLKKFLHAQSLFLEIIFYWSQNCKFNYEITSSANGWISITFCDVCIYNKISSIFNLEYINEVWIDGVLGSTGRYYTKPISVHIEPHKYQWKINQKVHYQTCRLVHFLFDQILIRIYGLCSIVL